MKAKCSEMCLSQNSISTHSRLKDILLLLLPGESITVYRSATEPGAFTIGFYDKTNNKRFGKNPHPPLKVKLTIL